MTGALGIKKSQVDLMIVHEGHGTASRLDCAPITGTLACVDVLVKVEARCLLTWCLLTRCLMCGSGRVRRVLASAMMTLPYRNQVVFATP